MALHGNPTRCAALGLDPAFFRRVRGAAEATRLVVEETAAAGAPEVLRADVVLAAADAQGVAELLRAGARGLVACVTHGDDQAVARALDAGAQDVVTPRARGAEVVARLLAVAERLDRERAARALLRAIAAEPLDPVGRSAALQRLVTAVAAVAPTSAPVRIEGEPGSGKTFVARRLHRASPRRDAPLLVVEGCSRNAAAALFGDASQAGALRNGRGCTVLVRHVERLAADVQTDVARWVSTRTLPRGPYAGEPSDARLVATSSGLLESFVAQGAVVPDLAAALGAVGVRVPPLRDRGDDALHLLTHFLREACSEPPALDAAARRLLLTHPWPGNAAEVRALAQLLAIRSPDRGLGEAEILPLLAFPWPRPAERGDPSGTSSVATLREAMLGHMVRVLALCGGNRTRAAKALGISARTLYNHLHATPDGRPGGAEGVAARTR